MIDRERLRIRLLDILGLMAPRDGWENDHRIERWLDSLMEADLEPREVERLERRVVELKLAFDLEKGVERELEADAMHLEDALRARMARDVHVIAIEAERDDLRRKIEAVRALAGGRRYIGIPALLYALDTPSTPVVDSG